MNTDPIKAAGDRLTVSCPSCGLNVEATAERCPRDGTVLLTAFSGETRLAAKYEFVSLLGSGGMGVIYKARQLGLGKMVAIKMMHQHFTRPESLQRFNLEARATAALSHRNIVKVHDFDITESGIPFIVMDYVDGITLAELLAKDCQLDQDRFFHLFAQVCDALGHAHGRGILHRDIKPSNIMIVKDSNGEDQILIMDFGLAKILDETEDPEKRALTRTGEMLGSPVYMSPEQAQSARVDHRSDLYSLGCVMYEALTGTPPFIGNSSVETMLMHVQSTPLPLKEAGLGASINYKMERLVLKLLSKDPASRYQNADLVAADLQSLQASIQSQIESESSDRAPGTKYSASGARSSTKAKSEKPQSKRTALVAAAAIGLILAATGIVVYLSRTHSQSPNKDRPGVQPAPNVSTAAPHPQAMDDIRDRIEHLLSERCKIIDLSEFAGHQINQQDLDLLSSAPAAAFVNTLILDRLNVSDAQLLPLTKLGKLRNLSLNGNPIKSINALAQPPLLESLRALSLSDTNIDENTIASINKFPNLNSLSLQATNFKEADLAGLKSLPELKRLDIRGSKFLPTEIAKLKSDLPHCQILTGGRPKPGLTAERAQELRHAAVALQAQGKWEEAADAWSTYLQSQEVESEALALDYQSQAKCYVKAGESNGAQSSFEKAASILENTSHGSDQLHAVYEDLASMSESAKDYDECVKYRKKALAWAKNNPAENSASDVTRQIHDLFNLAQAYANAGKTAESQHTYAACSQLFFEKERSLTNAALFESRNLAIQALTSQHLYKEAKKLCLQNLDPSVDPPWRNSATILIREIDAALNDQLPSASHPKSK